jgi:hypothetical protein
VDSVETVTGDRSIGNVVAGGIDFESGDATDATPNIAMAIADEQLSIGIEGRRTRVVQQGLRLTRDGRKRLQWSIAAEIVQKDSTVVAWIPSWQRNRRGKDETRLRARGAHE